LLSIRPQLKNDASSLPSGKVIPNRRHNKKLHPWKSAAFEKNKKNKKMQRDAFYDTLNI
jgi:hypothetical protein